MSILPAMQSAAVRLVGRKPSTFFGTSSQFEVEIVDLVTETAVDIAKSHDWQMLFQFNTINGNGVDTIFALPDDYDRLPIKGDVHSGTWATWRFTPVRDLDQLIDFQNGLGISNPGVWTILNGKMQFYPAPSSGEQAKFYYISKNFAQGQDAAFKSAFTNDNDEFLLPERLLTLGLIWRWRSQKKLEYAEDMANYEKALSEYIGTDKGRRIIGVGVPRGIAGVSAAYPGSLG